MGFLSNLSCTTDNYDELYARWLNGADDLLTLGKARPDEYVLDLCGGSGLVARTSLDIGCRPHLLDLNPNRCHDYRVIKKKGYAQDVGDYFPRHSFDLVVCRQAIGYIEPHNLAGMAEGIARILKPGGRFVFNNFLQPRWYKKLYRFNDRLYFEAAIYFDNIVYHLQASPGLGLDISRFYWHRHDDLMKILSKRFNIRTQSERRTMRYLCVVKD